MYKDRDLLLENKIQKTLTIKIQYSTKLKKPVKWDDDFEEELGSLLL